MHFSFKLYISQWSDYCHLGSQLSGAVRENLSFQESEIYKNKGHEDWAKTKGKE